MGLPFLLQVTVLTGPPLETQDTVYEEELNVSSALLRKPVKTYLFFNSCTVKINLETHLHLHCHRLLYREARLHCYWQ